MQRFQGLDRHRPCGALPEVAGTGPFLPPFVGMTPLATDGPGSGSGAGFGRDHAEKWQSRGVSRTTSMVTKTTSLAGLNPASPRTCAPSLTRSPPVQAPVVERGRRAVDPHPSRTGHVQSRDRPRRRTPLQRGQNRIEWFVRSRPGSRKRYPAHMTRKRPPGYYPVSPSRSHKQNRSTRPPPTPAQPGDTLFPTIRSRSVHAVRDRVPPAGASHGHPFSRRTSTVLTSGGRGHVDGGAQLCP